MIGEKFGRLTVLEIVSGKVLAVCDCGITKEYYSNNVKRGLTKSCGCFKNEETKKRNIANTKYGQSRHPLRKVWVHMIERCYNSNIQSYKDYGGRGISVCGEWKNDFMVFFNWALANGYAKGLEIDRENNDGNYEPLNCRFITPFENSRNRRSNVVITYNGKTQVLKDWAIELGLNYKTLHKKIKYKNQTFEQAICQC